MSVSGDDAPADPLLDLRTFASAVDSWLADPPGAVAATLAAALRPIPDYAPRVRAMADLMGALFDAGWSRYGWPTEAGGRGGTIFHRAAMWAALARHGLPGMALFEHLEILAPALVAKAPPPLLAERLPAYLSGRELWCQGFSEPDAGSDLASLRTTARATGDGDGYVVNGRKIWTSWARYADWCLLLARTGTPESRHRGLTALVVDVHAPGVEVRPIVQANGTDELAEVTFDDVVVPAGRVVGEVDGGWAVAVHILSHERGTFAWFRHLFLYEHLRACLADLPAPATDTGAPDTAAPDDAALGDVLLDLAAVTAAGHAGLRAHADELPLGPLAAFPKLLLCTAEQSTYDWVLGADPDIVLDVADDELAVRRQEYLFSRIVATYGGSQQMQLETIAKRVLRLP